MRCTECGFRLDPVNESQRVCPACGRDPGRGECAEFDSEIADALADVASLAAQCPLAAQGIEEVLPIDSQLDYLPDPELDLIMADCEAYLKALFEGPILVAGNRLIN